MSDLVIAQKQDLINIANAIREKAGTTDGMGIGEMAALIAAIESGGAKIATGTFTPSSNLAYFEVTHDLGIVPNIAFFVANYSPSRTYKDIGVYINGEGRTHQVSSNSYSFNVDYSYNIETTTPESSPSSCYGVVAYSANEKTIRFGNENINMYYFYSGMIYTWCVVGVM